MPRIPSPINWIKGGSNPNDLLMTITIPPWKSAEVGASEYSQAMSPTEVKDFLYDVVNSTIDRLELKTVNVDVVDEDGNTVRSNTIPSSPITEEAERLVPNPPSDIASIFFKGLDLASKDDDIGFNLNYWRKPEDYDAEAERNELLAIIDEYLTPPIQFSEIKCYGRRVEDPSVIASAVVWESLIFRPMNPIEDFYEFFGLE